ANADRVEGRRSATRARAQDPWIAFTPLVADTVPTRMDALPRVLVKNTHGSSEEQVHEVRRRQRRRSHDLQPLRRTAQEDDERVRARTAAMDRSGATPSRREGRSRRARRRRPGAP